MTKSQEALIALKTKYPEGIKDVRSLSEEQKAWVEITIKAITKDLKQQEIVAKLQKIHNRIAHATEDIPNKELQKIVSFVFENINEVGNVLK